MCNGKRLKAERDDRTAEAIEDWEATEGRRRRPKGDATENRVERTVSREEQCRWVDRKNPGSDYGKIIEKFDGLSKINKLRVQTSGGRIPRKNARKYRPDRQNLSGRQADDRNPRPG